MYVSVCVVLGSSSKVLDDGPSLPRRSNRRSRPFSFWIVLYRATSAGVVLNGDTLENVESDGNGGDDDDDGFEK